MIATRDEVKRHMQMLYEQFRAEIKVLGDGHAAHETRLEEHHARITRLERRRPLK